MMWYDLKKGKKFVAKTKNTVRIYKKRKILIKMTKKITNEKNLVTQSKFKGHRKQENLRYLSLKYSYSSNIQ